MKLSMTKSTIHLEDVVISILNDILPAWTRSFRLDGFSLQKNNCHQLRIKLKRMGLSQWRNQIGNYHHQQYLRCSQVRQTAIQFPEILFLDLCVPGILHRWHLPSYMETTSDKRLCHQYKLKHSQLRQAWPFKGYLHVISLLSTVSIICPPFCNLKILPKAFVCFSSLIIAACFCSRFWHSLVC